MTHPLGVKTMLLVLHLSDVAAIVLGQKASRVPGAPQTDIPLIHSESSKLHRILPVNLSFALTPARTARANRTRAESTDTC